MHLAGANPKAANLPEEEQRHRALQPLIEILLHIAAQQWVGDRHFDARGSGCQITAVDPVRLGEPRTLEGDGQCRREKLDPIAQAERALEADAAKSDRMERALV